VQDPKQHKQDRRCAWVGCTTTLSMYNSDYLCWVHADERTRTRHERIVTSGIGPDQRAPRAGRSDVGSHHLLAGSSRQGIRIVDPRALASIRTGNDTRR